MSYFYDVCLADMQKVMTTFGNEQFCNRKLVLREIGHLDNEAFKQCVYFRDKERVFRLLTTPISLPPPTDHFSLKIDVHSETTWICVQES